MSQNEYRFVMDTDDVRAMLGAMEGWIAERNENGYKVRGVLSALTSLEEQLETYQLQQKRKELEEQMADLEKRKNELRG